MTFRIRPECQQTTAGCVCKANQLWGPPSHGSSQAYAEGRAAGLEKAASWHDDRQEGGHSGESATEAMLRQRRNSWHKEAAAAIRAAIRAALTAKETK